MNLDSPAHPLRLFRYCPACGSTRFREHDFKSKRCDDCGFTYYHNASAATVAVVIDGAQRLLVARRALNPAAGTLDLPGGFVDAGETLEACLQRELVEETGVAFPLERYLFSLPNTYPYSGFEVHTTDAFFLCRADGQCVQAADDVAALQWVPLRSVQAEAFGLSSVRAGVERLLRLCADGRLI